MKVIEEEKKENLKKLKKGDFIYSTEFNSEDDNIIVHKLIFDSWKDENKYIANVKYNDCEENKIKIDPMDISYGWFISKKASLESFYSIIKYVYKKAEDALKKV